jgi:hypothetical protein
MYILRTYYTIPAAARETMQHTRFVNRATCPRAFRTPYGVHVPCSDSGGGRLDSVEQRSPPQPAPRDPKLGLFVDQPDREVSIQFPMCQDSVLSGAIRGPVDEKLFVALGSPQYIVMVYRSMTIACCMILQSVQRGYPPCNMRVAPEIKINGWIIM